VKDAYGKSPELIVAGQLLPSSVVPTFAVWKDCGISPTGSHVAAARWFAQQIETIPDVVGMRHRFDPGSGGDSLNPGGCGGFGNRCVQGDPRAGACE